MFIEVHARPILEKGLVNTIGGKRLLLFAARNNQTIFFKLTGARGHCEESLRSQGRSHLLKPLSLHFTSLSREEVVRANLQWSCIGIKKRTIGGKGHFLKTCGKTGYNFCCLCMM